MRKLKYILSVFCIVFGLVALVAPVFVHADVGDESTADAGPWSATNAKRLEAEYIAAIKDCSNPSLECLVHYVSTYLAIEMTNSILFPQGAPGPAAMNGESGTPVADSTTQPSSGLVNGLLHVSSLMYQYPVAHSTTYVADVFNSAHIATTAQAQGVGFAALDPVLTLWKTFRNIAYLFFVIIFIVIGFMIMLRRQVNGQTALTAQQAIPGVIVSLLFVTFSYAIAGFMIDLMYLSMFMIIGLFPATFALDGANIIDFNILELADALFRQTNVLDLGNNAGIDIVSNFMTSLQVSEAVANVTGVVGGLTLSLVLAIAILIAVFRLFFELLRSYAGVLMSVITSPIYLMMGALPNNSQFMPWLKDLVANLSVFPTVLLIVVLFQTFAAEGSVARTQGGFLPPFLLGRGQTGAIASLMGLALILALPEIVKEVKTKIGAREGIGTKIAGWATNRAKQGWSGGELIPGLAATNTGKYINPQKMWGAVGQKAAVGVAAGAGAVGGAAWAPIVRKRTGQTTVTRWSEAKEKAAKAARWAGDKVNDPHFNNKKKDDKTTPGSGH